MKNVFSKGLCSVSFRNNTAEEILAACKNSGLSCIEWGSDIHAKCCDKDNLKYIAALQEKYGIFCSSYGAYFRLGTDNINELSRYISAAKVLGTDILRIWCGDRQRELLTATENAFVVDEAKRAAEIACKHGAALCLECHNNTYTQTLDGALEIMESVCCENLKMYWQPNQFVNVDENVKYAKGISKYVINIHVFNWQGNEKHPLCDGIEVWKKYLDCFEDNKTLLLEFMPDGRIETLGAEAEALDGIILQ